MTRTQKLEYGTKSIEYELVTEPRKTLSITVKPDLSVIVRAPENSDPKLIEEKISKRANWITKKLRQYELYLPDVPPRQYVSGESHRYLGKQYRLKVNKAKPGEEGERVHN